jgi:hypothetical protein
MNVVFYPDLKGREGLEGPVRGFLKWLQRKHPDIWTLWNKTLEVAKKPGGLDLLQRQDRVGTLKYQSYPILEFRVPKKRSGGVARIYFCHDPNERERIVLLEAEWKKTAETSSQKLASACERYRGLFK